MHQSDVPAGHEVLFDFQQRILAHKTVDAWDNIPHAGMVMDLDATNVLAFVKALRDHPEFRDVRVTLNSVMLKIIAEALKESPELNAHVKHDRKSDLGSFVYHDEINIAVPFLLEDGRTISVVVKDVGGKSLREVCQTMADMPRRVYNTDVDCMMYEGAIRDTIARLKRLELGVLRRVFANFIGKTKVRMPSRQELRRYRETPDEDKITVDDFLSATILVSNIGSIMPELRGHINLLEIIPPQAAVIGLCAVQKRPVVVTDEEGDDSIEIREILPLTIYIDHRAIALSQMIGFLKRILELCERPELLGVEMPSPVEAEPVAAL
jgi:pyruvate/2-oxoglutarate dehydrogenase complex dihydrolipoamide acyltransferase (E2) component